MTFARQRKVDAALAIVGEDLNQDLVWEALQMPGSGVTLINGRRVLQGHNSLAGVGDRVAALVIVENGHLDELLTSLSSFSEEKSFTDKSRPAKQRNPGRPKQRQLGIGLRSERSHWVHQHEPFPACATDKDQECRSGSHHRSRLPHRRGRGSKACYAGTGSHLKIQVTYIHSPSKVMKMLFTIQFRDSCK